jgi:hypothetical protein
VYKESEGVPRKKGLWIRGPASLPDVPETEDAKPVVYVEKLE